MLDNMINSEKPYKLAEIIRDTWPNIYRPAKASHNNKKDTFHKVKENL